jgi:hypothetical protein
MLPLYEAKMIFHFDHRLGTYQGQTEAQANVGTLPRLTLEQQNEPDFALLPRYWVSEAEVEERLAERWNLDWLLGFRAISLSSNERTMVTSVIPRTAAGHSIFLMLPSSRVSLSALLPASLSSFVLDFVTRQKMAGSNLNFFLVKQLPVLPPTIYDQTAPWNQAVTLAHWFLPRVIELTYTAWELLGFARDLGDEEPPFRWDVKRRCNLRAELDAAYFHLYGVERDDVDYIMETFPIVRRKDMEHYGSFRTKDLILDIYDMMAEAIRTGEPYQTILDPPPGHGSRHPAR